MDEISYDTESKVIHEDVNSSPVVSYKRISSVFSKSFNSLFKGRRNLAELFNSLIKKLDKFFSLTRAVLVVYSAREEKLKVIAMKGPRSFRDGLALTLPKKNSLFYRIFENKKTFTQNYPDKFDGNFIEKKLLLNNDTSSIAICPISHKGSIKGLLCLTSPTLYAFGMFEDGFLDHVLERFGKSVEIEINKLYF